MKLVNTWCFGVISLFVFSIQAQSLEFNSGERQVQLVELYTSQSCSSCPPADSWVSQMKSSSDLWTRFIPVAFHVSYWNYLSWRDRFSKDAFSKRQRKSAGIIGSSVYTPQVVLNGKDFPQWRRVRNIASLYSNKINGNLNAQVSADFKTASMNFTAKQNLGDLICEAAYIENGHIADVKRGENEGNVFPQDFVVMSHVEGTMKKNARQYSCRVQLDVNRGKIPQKKALVFWVKSKNTHRVIQATGGQI